MGGVAGKYMIDALNSDSGSENHAEIMPSMRTFVNCDQAYVNRCVSRFKSGGGDQNFGFCPGVKFQEFKHIFGGNKGVLLSLFHSFDTDRNGLVDVHEVLSCMILCSKMKAEPKWRVLFDLHDENGDAELSEAEIDMMMISCHRGMAKMINRSHMSNTTVHGIAQFIFHAMDRDLNGHLDKGEFIAFCRESPEVTHYFNRIGEFSVSTVSVSKQFGASTKKERIDYRSQYKQRRTLKHPPFNRGATGGEILEVRVGGLGDLRPGRGSPGRGSLSKDDELVFNEYSGMVTGGRFSSPIPPTTMSPSKISVRGSGCRRKEVSKHTDTANPANTGGLGMSAPNGGTMDIELLRQIFSGIDSNLDGIIDVGEFYLSLKNTSLEDSALALFNKVDKDKNGQLTMTELITHLFPFAEEDDIDNILAWVKNGDIGTKIWGSGEEESEYAAMFRSFDLNGDKKITLRELAATMAQVHNLDRKDCEKLFGDLGKGKRDCITEEEFVDMLKSFVSGNELGAYKLGQNPVNTGGGGREGSTGQRSQPQRLKRRSTKRTRLAKV